MAEPSSSNNANTQGNPTTTHSGGSKRKKNKHKQNQQQSQDLPTNLLKKASQKNPASLETDKGTGTHNYKLRDESKTQCSSMKAINELSEVNGQSLENQPIPAQQSASDATTSTNVQSKKKQQTSGQKLSELESSLKNK